MAVPTLLSRSLAAALVALVAGGCSLLQGLGGAPVASTSAGPSPAALSAAPVTGGEPGGERFPDVLAVELRPQGDHVYDVAVTLSSPYDSPERYADGWRVLDAEGRELGRHTLLHDHAAEQPFTRVQRGLHIPEEVDEVTVQGRDLANGYGGLTITLPVPDG